MSTHSKATPKAVFISYRRGDAAAYADLAFEILNKHLPGQVFFDKEGIEYGAEYGEVLRHAAGNCKFLLVLIGEQWKPEQLNNSNDWVRIEISSAIKGGARIIPVVLPRGALPTVDVLPVDLAQLVSQHALTVASGGKEFESIAQDIKQKLPVGMRLIYTLRQHKAWIVSAAALLAMTCAIALTVPRTDLARLWRQFSSVLTQSRSFTVSASHQGDYSSISEAIANAEPGTQIHIQPGRYREGLIIDKPLELIGDGKTEDVIIEAADQHVILFRTTTGRVANVTIRQLGGDGSHAVNITQGRLEVENCDVSSRGSAAVAIHGDAAPRLYNNRIHSSVRGGITIYENGQGTLESNNIVANEAFGVEIKESANPLLRSNRIHGNKKGGVIISENAIGTLEDNEISSNQPIGIAISAEAAPILRRNRIHNHKEGAGIFF